MKDSQSTPTCDFCGKPLEPVVVEVFGRTITPAFKPCGCALSQQRIEASLAREARADAEARASSEARAARAAGIPERYLGATTERLDLVEKAEAGLWIEGPSGTGKTHLACAIGMEFLRSGKTVRFLKAADLVDMLADFSSHLEAIEEIKRPHLLIIDDLGMTEAKAWSDMRTRRAIDARWDSGKPLIVTSNFSRKKLAERMAGSSPENAEAVVSRLFGMTERVVLGGGDRRIGRG